MQLGSEHDINMEAWLQDSITYLIRLKVNAALTRNLRQFLEEVTDAFPIDVNRIRDYLKKHFGHECTFNPEQLRSGYFLKDFYLVCLMTLLPNQKMNPMDIHEACREEFEHVDGPRMSDMSRIATLAQNAINVLTLQNPAPATQTPSGGSVDPEAQSKTRSLEPGTHETMEPEINQRKHPETGHPQQWFDGGWVNLPPLKPTSSAFLLFEAEADQKGNLLTHEPPPVPEDDDDGEI